MIQRLATSLFKKIAEPRVIRIMLFVIYTFMTIAGIGVIVTPPRSFQGVLGHSLVMIFGGFIALGGLMAWLAVLPGIWWLERVGLLALITGMGIYTVAIISLGSSFMGVIVSLTFALFFAIRWQEIKRFQLAPLDPKER